MIKFDKDKAIIKKLYIYYLVSLIAYPVRDK